jgi:hypothetical protein
VSGQGNPALQGDFNVTVASADSMYGQGLTLIFPRTQIGVKESFILHLISEVKIDQPEKGDNEENRKRLRG